MIRAAVATGRFYPADPDELARTVDTLLGPPEPDASVRALVAPHAGYAYSGAVAGSAFRLLLRRARVVLLGPSHFVPLEGMAVSSADAWQTPLGRVEVDDELRAAALAAGAALDDASHERDHALEVELPFLQRACTCGLSILPVAVGRTAPAEVADLITGLPAVVVVSTDLSHYHDDATARRLDRTTADAVVARDPAAIGDDAACGVHALRGLVEHARRVDLPIRLLDLRTSADAADDRDRVVGYGAFAVGG